MDIATVVMTVVLLIYNIATTRLLSFALNQIDIRKAVQEKAPEVRALAAIDPPAGPSSQDTSYSRVSGMIGAVVLASFFWAVGNVILYKAFVAPADIRELVSSLGTFFLGGSSLFLPYAFNQLREAFGSNR